MDIDVSFALGLKDVCDCEKWDVEISNSEMGQMKLEVIYFPQNDELVVLSPSHLANKDLPSGILDGILKTRSKIKDRDGIPSYVDDFAGSLDYSENIFIRVKDIENGGYAVIPISDAPVDVVVGYIKRWLLARHIPCRTSSDLCEKSDSGEEEEKI